MLIAYIYRGQTLKRRKIRYEGLAKAANRVTGVETPVFGISWNPPTLDVEVAERLVTFLEDRRALYNPFDRETLDWVIESILEIRRKLTEYMEQLDRDSPLAKSMAAMRSACRTFLDRVERDAPGSPHWRLYSPHFFLALGELRSIIGIHVAQIAARHGINIEEQLASIVPTELDEE